MHTPEKVETAAPAHPAHEATGSNLFSDAYSKGIGYAISHHKEEALAVVGATAAVVGAIALTRGRALTGIVERAGAGETAEASSLMQSAYRHVPYRVPQTEIRLAGGHSQVELSGYNDVPKPDLLADIRRAQSDRVLPGSKGGAHSVDHLGGQPINPSTMSGYRAVPYRVAALEPRTAPGINGTDGYKFAPSRLPGARAESAEARYLFTEKR